MPQYRRVYIPGAAYFFTTVTYNRQKIFTNDKTISLLRKAIHETKQQLPFTIDAWVTLPDHIHTIWVMPDNDYDYSKRWALIKRYFSKYMNACNSITKRYWQNRFWEHTIRNEKEYGIYIQYIHFNPVKHGYVRSVRDWPYSSFHEYVRRGIYPPDWASCVDERDGAFGE